MSSLTALGGKCTDCFLCRVIKDRVQNNSSIRSLPERINDCTSANVSSEVNLYSSNSLTAVSCSNGRTAFRK